MWFFPITVQKGDGRSQRLDTLVSEAERRVVDLTQAVINGASGNSSVSSNQHKVGARFKSQCSLFDRFKSQCSLFVNDSQSAN